MMIHDVFLVGFSAINIINHPPESSRDVGLQPGQQSLQSRDAPEELGQIADDDLSPCTAWNS